MRQLARTQDSILWPADIENGRARGTYLLSYWSSPHEITNFRLHVINKGVNYFQGTICCLLVPGHQAGSCCTCPDVRLYMDAVLFPPQEIVALVYSLVTNYINNSKSNNVMFCCSLHTAMLKVISNLNSKTKKNSVVLGREQTIPTERQPLVGEVSANFWEERVSSGNLNSNPFKIFWKKILGIFLTSP
jgi:hypothetical protein